MYNIRSGVIRLEILDFLSDDSSSVCIFQPFLAKIATWKV